VNIRSARFISVMEVVTYEGSGTPEDLGREVTSYYFPDGTLLARSDPQPKPVVIPPTRSALQQTVTQKASVAIRAS
jgi:hypothetical protein